MNAKKFFYRDYFRDIDFSVKTKKKEELTTDDKRVIEANEGKFKTRNEKLFAFVPDLEFANQCFDRTCWAETDETTLWTTYPGLFTGSGYTHETGIKHELMLGFFFDHTTGLPLLAGSSVKGTLRSVFPQFDGKDDNPLLPQYESEKKEGRLQLAKSKFVAALFGMEDSPELVHQLELAIFENVDVPASLAKPDDLAKGKLHYLPTAKHDVFHDAFIRSSQAPGRRIFGEDVITPHGKDPLKNPVPLPFLKVLPDVQWAFPMVLQTTQLMENLAIDAQKKRAAFTEILCTVGVGAKTNVGYGRLVTDEAYQQTKVPASNKSPIRPKFEEGQEVSMEIEYIDWNENKLYVSVKHNSSEIFPIQVDKKSISNYITGSIYPAIVRKLNEDGSIKFLNPKKI